MKRAFLKVFVLILFSGCSLTKKEAFNLKYNERKVIDTFEKVPLYFINPDGSFNFADYSVFEFDGDLLTAKFEHRTKTRSTVSEKYAVEIIEDISPLEGVYRLHGSGSYGGKYLGITAITNGAGSYAKFALGDNKEGLLKKSREIKHWQYASQPLVGRAFNSFTNSEVIVKLHHSDLKYHVQTTTNAVFESDATGTVPKKIYFTNVQPNAADPKKPSKTELESFTVTGVQLFPPSIEVYSLQNGEFFGIEYHTNTQLEKLQMRFAQESTVDAVLSSLQKRSADYDWESENTADIPHRVLSLVARNPIVTLSSFSANPIGSSTTSIKIPAAYDWENTTQYSFDLVTMTAEVITVHDKITNTSSYKVRMISDLSETKGIIRFIGRGVLNQQYGLLEITNKSNLSGYLVLATSEDNLTVATAVKTPVQDKVIAQQPHRVVIEMQRRGKSWVGVHETGVYSMTNTTNWTFDSEKLLVQAKIMTNTTPKTSTYKIKMLNNFSDNQGSFQLLTTTDIIPGLTADTDGKPFENYVLAVKLGSGVDNVRAMLEVNESQARAEELLEKRVVWNFYEQSAVPSGNRIIKTLASIHPWIKLSSSGYYTETDTEVWWFDPDAMSAIVMEIDNTSGTVTTNGASYEVEMSLDLGVVEGGFKLKNPTPIDKDYPRVTTPVNQLTLNTTFQEKFMYVLTGTAVNASKAYIGIGDTIDDAKAQKPPVKNNYHTLDNAPLSAITIEAAVNNAKNQGHKYVALQAPAAPDSGSYLPYNTEELVFSVDPLQVEITVITPDNKRKKETHPIQIVRAINSTEAIFKYLGTGSLAGKFAGFRVQAAQGSALGTHLIITNADSLDAAEGELQKLKTADQWTHDVKQKRLIPDTNFNDNLGPWGAVDLAASSSGMTYDHLLYDSHNTTNFTFNTTVKTVKVDLINRDITNSSTYDYEVMSQNAVTSSSQKYTTIVRLTGDGAWNTRYLGVERMSHTLDSKTFKHSKIIMSSTYDDTLKALTTTATNYYEVSVLNFPKGAIQRANGDAASGAIGDTLVMVDDKGIWNADNTQELRFRLSDMTVNISDVDATGTRSHRYNIIVERTTTAPAKNTDEAEAILYLKSFENDDTAKLHKKFVKMKVESGATPKKIRFVTADNKSAADAAFTALNGKPNQWNFQDRTSTAIDVRVIATAGDKTWTKLAPNLYYWDSSQVEQWTFNAAAKTVQVVSTNGNTIKTENYRIGMKESISATEGIFLLAGLNSSDMKYNSHMVYLGFGTEKNDRDANGLLLTTSTGDEASRIAHLKSEAQKMKTAHNWNLREKSLAELSNRAVANAAKVAEWRSLEDTSTVGTLKYDSANYTSLKFSADTANNKLTNIVIQKVGTSAKGPITFQHKMHQDVSDYRGIFQLYNGSDAEYTNKYMAIELGTAVNDRLLKVGIGDTPLDAQNKLNEQTIWNYMDKNMAEANDRIVQEAIKRGSAVWIFYDGTSGPHQPVRSGQTSGITFDAGNATNLVFDPSIQTLKMQYITTTPGSGGAVATTVTNEFVYGYTIIEDTSETEGVFRLDGFGDYNRLFVSGVLGVGSSITDPDYRRARIGFGEDVTSAKQARNSTELSGKYNILARPSLLVGDRVLVTLRNLVDTKGSVVRTTGPENNAFDTRNTKKFKFVEDPVIGPMVQIVEVISNVHITNLYNVFMTYDKSSTEGVFRVENLGSPDNNKVFGLKIGNDKIHLWEAADAATAKSQLDGTAGQTVPTAQYQYETNIAVPGRDTILQKFNDLAQISMLDSDQIYLAHDTELWTHNVANGDMSVTKIPPGAATVTTLYKVVPITNIVPAAGETTKGAFLLQSDQVSSPYHNKYVAMTVMNNNSIKLTTNDTLAAAIADLNSRTHENFVRSSDVQIDDSVLEKAGSEFKGEWAILLRNAGNATYLFDYKNTEKWKFSAKERKIEITSIINGVEKVGTYRLQLRGITGNDNASDKISGKLIHKSGDFNTHNNKFVSIKLPSGEFNTLFWGIGDTFAVAKTLRDGSDPLMIPLQYGMNSRAAIEKFNEIGRQDCWYPVDARGNVQQNAYVYDPNPGSGKNHTAIPGPTYTININLGKYNYANGSHSHIPNTLLGNFFVRIIEATDDNNVVFLTYKGASPYNASSKVVNELRSEFSNKYSAIQIGTGPDVFRAKIARGDTLNEAKANLNALTYWNYVTKLGVDAGDYITNLEIQGGVDQNNIWVGNADGGKRVATYNANNTTNWNIDAHNQAAVIDIINGNVTNSSTYGITRLQRYSGNKGIFLIEGYGPFNRKLVMVERGISADNRNKLRLIMHDNVTNLTNMFNNISTTPNPDGTVDADAKWNFRRRDDILPTLGVVSTAADVGPIVSLFDFNTTTPRRVYDPEETTEYSFDKVNRKATISVTTGGVTSSYTFDVIMSEHISNNEGVFQLVNGPPLAAAFNNWFYAMKISGNNVVITSNSSAATAKAQMQAISIGDNDNTHFRLKSSRPIPNSRIMTDLATGGSIVSLDDYRSYRDHTTTEFVFDAATRIVQIVVKADGRITSSDVYKVVVVEDYVNNATGTDQFKGSLLLKGSTSSATYNNQFFTVQRHYANISSTDYNNDLTTNAFRFANGANLNTAKNSLNTMVYKYHRKAPLVFDDSAFETLATLYDGKWASLGLSGRNMYLYDRRNTQEMAFDYKNKLFEITNITPVSGNVTAATTNIGKYAIWVTNVQGETDNASDKITFKFKFISGTFTDFSDKWGSIRFPAARDSIYRGFGQSTPAEAKQQRDNGGDPTLIPLLHATNSSGAISNLNRLGKVDCWHPVDQDGKSAKGQMVYDPNPGQNNAINPGPPYAVNFNLGLWSNAPDKPAEVGTQRFNNIPASELNRFFVRIIESSDDYNAVFRTYHGLRRGNDNTYINVLTNPSGLWNVSNIYHAITVGTGPNLYKAKIARGKTAREAQANLNALTYYNYRSKQALGTTGTLGTITNAISIITNIGFNGSKWWSGNVNGQALAVNMIDATVSGRLISVRPQGVGHQVNNTYQMEHLYAGYDHEHNNGITSTSNSGNRIIFKLVGFGPYANKIVRVLQASNNSRGKKTMKFVMGDGILDQNGVIDIDRQWAQLTGNTGNMVEN